MPRDLFRAADDALPASTGSDTPENDHGGGGDDAAATATAENAAGSGLPHLHTFTQTLSSSNVESCTALEAACFSPEERATRAKIDYRLRTCPELCLGIFTSDTGNNTVTADAAAPVDSNTPERKAILLGLIVATKTTHPTVTDDDMAFPTETNLDPKLGHKEHGRTICVHSLAILPDYQHQRLGSTLLKAYISRMQSQAVGDSIALIAHDYLVPFYEQFEFKNLGPSKAQFGGGGWFDMVLDLKHA